MKLTKILKSRRGVALETAIIFMLIIFMLCTLLTSLTLLGHYQVKIENLTLTRDVEIDQIGEDFVANDMEEKYDNYSYEVDKNTLTVERGNKRVLYVEVDENRNVIAWRYS